MILVTGGAGYIGSHCVLALLEQGFDVIAFDNLSTGHKETVQALSFVGQKKFHFIEGDLLDAEKINSVFINKIDAVIHFAAFSQVGESVIYPEKYYRNNVVGTLNLINAMIHNNVRKIVFSSTAAIYGEPKYIPIDENHPKEPINPYGQTKLMIEKIMDDYDKAHSLKSVRLRYFNAAGADSKGINGTRTGEWHEPETHLIPNILKTTFKENEIVKIYGNDYETQDGTCIRDYVNVEDLANAHVLALKYLLKGGMSDCFNLGTNEGYSVKQVLETCQEVTAKTISKKIINRREGDPAVLIANNKKALKVLGWKPNKTLKDSIKSAYEWEIKLQETLKKEVLTNA